MQAISILFLLILLYLFEFFQNCEQLVYFAFFFIKLSQYHKIHFFVNANIDILFRFFKNKFDNCIENSFHFLFNIDVQFYCNRKLKKNDDKNTLNDCFDWKIFLIIRKWSSTTVFRNNNIFFFAKNDFNFSCKTSFVCFSMIFKINCDNKLKNKQQIKQILKE